MGLFSRLALGDLLLVVRLGHKVVYLGLQGRCGMAVSTLAGYGVLGRNLMVGNYPVLIQGTGNERL